MTDNNNLNMLKSFSSKLNDFKNSKVTAITPKKCLEILNLPELEAD